MIVSTQKHWLCSFFLIWFVCSASSATTVSSIPGQSKILFEVRWGGLDQISSSNSMRQIVELPESRNVADQALQKLSIAPWTWLDRPIDIEASSPLRSFLHEAIRRESAFALIELDKESLAAVISVRVGKVELDRWKTNLAISAASLLGKTVEKRQHSANGWFIFRNPHTNQSNWLNAISLKCVDDKIFLSFASNSNSAEMVTTQMSRGWTGSNSVWLKATVDFPRLKRFEPFSSLSTNLFPALPTMELTVKGHDQKVETQIAFTFAHPMDLKLPEWRVPTNLIERPSASFSAVRGLDFLLLRSPIWRKLSISPAPEQLFVWALEGQPRLTFFAANVTNSNAFVDQVVDKVLPTGEAWLNEEGIAGFKKSPENGGLEWQGMPYVWPFLRSIATNGENFVLGGTFVYVPVIAPPSPDFFSAALKPANQVYYGWEKTGPRIEHWLFLGQFIRFVSGKAQMPFDCATLKWLKSLENNLDETTTRIFLKSPNQLQLTRISSLGLTAIELHLLADWLESPAFPKGTHTMLAKPEPRP